MAPIRAFLIDRKQHLLLALCLLLLTASTLPGQVQPTAAQPATPTVDPYGNRWDVYGGFSYAHFNGIGNSSATQLLGWNGQATAWIRPVFGLAVSGRGDYGHYPANAPAFNVTNPPISQHLFLFGPDFRLWRTPRNVLGLHVMVGGVYGRFQSGLKGAPPNGLSLYTDQLAFAAAVGGSFDHHISPRLSVRLITDWEPTHFGPAIQEEFAGSIGVVYKLGSLSAGK